VGVTETCGKPSAHVLHKLRNWSIWLETTASSAVVKYGMLQGSFNHLAADLCHIQRCQVSRFRRETPVFRRPLWPPVWQDLSPIFTFYRWHVRQRPPHTRWWSRCLAARLPSAPLGHKFACIFVPYNCQKSSLILELCLLFLNIAGWHLCIYMYVRCWKSIQKPITYANIFCGILVQSLERNTTPEFGIRFSALVFIHVVSSFIVIRVCIKTDMIQVLTWFTVLSLVCFILAICTVIQWQYQLSIFFFAYYYWYLFFLCVFLVVHDTT